MIGVYFSRSILLLALATNLVGGAVAVLSYFLLAGYALLGRAQLIQSLALLSFFSVLNDGITLTSQSDASVLRYIPTIGATLSLLLRSHASIARGRLSISLLVLSALCLGAFLFIHSMLFSQMADVSILKTVVWVTLLVILLSSWRGLSNLEHDRLKRQLFGGLVVSMLASLPFLAITNIGYATNGNGFQGIFNQPQVFGLVMATLAACIIGRLSQPVRYRWLDMFLLVLSLLLLLMSESRTAGFALVLALAGTPIIFFVFRGRGRSLLKSLASMSAILFVIWFSFSEQLTKFAFKRDNAVDISQTIEASRGILMFPMIANIVENPMSGIGFGVGSIPSERSVNRDNILGLPTGAPVEKGVLPLAVIEELGAPGFLAVALWLWMMFRRSYRAGFYPFLVLSLVLLMNLGEATFFATGSIGLFFLIMITWAVTAKDRSINKLSERKIY
jgi:hypothetical protein